jgi:hypothetical protein
LVDIFDEVEEDLRAERAKHLWRRFAPAAIALAVLLVAAVGGYQFWRHRAAERAAAAAASLLAAGTQADKTQAAAALTAVAANAPAGVAALARLRAAGLKAETGDLAGALAEWNAVAADHSLDRVYRDLASLNWVLHQIDRAAPDTLTPRLAPLMEEGAPWRASARELSALIDMRAGKADAAKVTLMALAGDLTAPEGVRARARDLLAGMGG